MKRGHVKDLLRRLPKLRRSLGLLDGADEEENSAASSAPASTRGTGAPTASTVVLSAAPTSLSASVAPARSVSGPAPSAATDGATASEPRHQQESPPASSPMSGLGAPALVRSSSTESAVTDRSR